MKPSLFIIGGPKCGTTALCSYLAEHPNVCFSVPKEAKYFHTDFSSKHRLAMSEAEYLGCFNADPNKHLVLAEGTVWYLFSREAVPNILRFNPDARFVVLIRNPVNLAHSLHSQLLYGGDENIESFEEAWNLQASRRDGRNLPKGARDPKSLLYGEVAKQGKQLERLFSFVPQERVLVINFDDFSTDPRCEYRRLLEFSGLPDDDRRVFPRVNESKTLRRNPLRTLLLGLRPIKTALGIKKSFGIWQAAQPFVARTSKRTRLPRKFAEALHGYFLEDIERTEQLLDLDLHAWKHAEESEAPLRVKES